METIDIELGEFTRRSRSVVLRHTATALRRGLEPGEQVLLRDPRLGCFTASVVDIDFDLDDTVYRVELGVRISDQEAAERARRPVSDGGAPVGRQELLGLLGQLRSAAHTLQHGLGRSGEVAVRR